MKESVGVECGDGIFARPQIIAPLLSWRAWRTEGGKTFFVFPQKKGRWRREGMENTSSFSFSSPVFLRYMVARIKKCGEMGGGRDGRWNLLPVPLSFLPRLHAFYLPNRGSICSSFLCIHSGENRCEKMRNNNEAD